MPEWVLKMMSPFSKGSKDTLEYWNRELEFDNGASRQVLGIEYKRGLGELMKETALQMIKCGKVADKPAK